MTTNTLTKIKSKTENLKMKTNSNIKNYFKDIKIALDQIHIFNLH